PCVSPELHHRDARDLRDSDASRAGDRASSIPRHLTRERTRLRVDDRLRQHLRARHSPAPCSTRIGPLQLVSVIFSFGVTAAFIFMLQISQIIGQRTLRDWVLGRYHRPRQEHRFFLFIDIAGSTTLAERLGPVAVINFSIVCSWRLPILSTITAVRSISTWATKW